MTRRRARLNCIAHILNLIPYKKVAAREGQAAEALDEGRLRRRSAVEGAEVRAGKILKVSNAARSGVSMGACPSWLRTYNKGWLRFDVAAGITLAAYFVAGWTRRRFAR